MKYVKIFEKFNQGQIDHIIKELDLRYNVYISEHNMDIIISLDDMGYNLSEYKTLVRRKLLSEIEGLFEYNTPTLNKAIKIFLNRKIEEYTKIIKNNEFDDVNTLLNKITKFFKLLKLDYIIDEETNSDDYVDKYKIYLKNSSELKIFIYDDDVLKFPTININYYMNSSDEIGYRSDTVPNFKKLTEYLFKHKIVDSKNILLKINK